MRALVLCLLLLALAFAGCVDPSVDARAGSQKALKAPRINLGVPAIAELLPEKVLVGKGGDAETSLTISKDGKTVLACSHGGFSKPSPLWASVDAGKTFAFIDPQPNPIVSGDCDVAITDDGNWYMLYDTIASATVAVSKDKGKTWSFHYAAAPPFGGVDRPWIEAVGNTVYLTYANVMVAQPAILMFAKTTDSGATWTSYSMAAKAEGREGLNCVNGHMIVKDQGKTIRVPLDCWDSTTAGAKHSLEFAISRDGGVTWKREPVLPAMTSGLRLPVATYAGDAIWFAYTLGQSTVQVLAIRSLDDGKTWSEPVVVASDLSTGLAAVWIDGRADGTVSLAWLHNTKPANFSGTGQVWQGDVARIDANMTIVFHGNFMEPYAARQTLEFLMIRHDPATGRAFLLYPMGGPGCQLRPATPAGEAQGRNNQCVNLLIENGGRIGG